MSAISLKSITGITSITTPAGVDNQLTLHTNDTTQRVKVTQSGIEVAGVTTASHLTVLANTNLGNSSTDVVTITGNVDLNGDIDVDGHTNLDNVSVAGITTFSNGPVVVNGQYYRGIINSGSQQKIIGGYISGTDTLRLGESMYLTSTGLGIGIASPSNKLEISGGLVRCLGTASARFTANNGSAEGYFGWSSGVLTVGQAAATLSLEATGSNHIQLKTNGSERLRITSGGQVSISGAGTTFGNNTLLNIAPANRTTAFDASDGNTWHDLVLKQGAAATTNSVGIAFEVSPSAYHKNAGTGIAAIKDGNNFDYGAHLAFVTRPHTAVAQERLRITSQGKVGVNQTTWTNKDHMFEVNQSTNDKEIARFTNTGGTSGSVQGKGFIGLSLFNTTTHPHAYVGVEEAGTGNYEGNLTFATRSASNDSAPIERLRIDQNGKVGMGLVSTSASNTCDPDGNQLLIRGASTVATKRGHIMLTGDSATVGQGPQIVFSESGSGSSYAGGYVGFLRTGSNSIGDLVFGTRGTTGDANTVPDERLRITSVGKVGINEDDPYYMLDIKIADSTTALSGGSAGDWGGNGIRLSNTSTTVGSMSLFHFRTNDADWHIGGKLVSANNSNFVFNHEGNERLVLSSTGQLSLKSNDGLYIRPETDSNDAKITFSTNNNNGNTQIGHIKYNHQDNAILSGYGEGIIMGGTESNGFILRVDGGINLKDSGSFSGNGCKLSLGTDQDMRIYHTGGDGYIDGAGTGGLRVRWNDQIFSNYNSSGTRRFRVFKDEGVEIYAETNGGEVVSGTGQGISIRMSDNNGANPTQIGSITYKHSDNAFVNDGTNECFKIHGTENQTALLLDGRMYISDSKFVLKPTFSNFDDIPNGTNSGNSVGCMMKYNNEANGNSGVMSNSAVEPFIANRSGSDGIIMRIRHQGNTEGQITVSGGTVSYQNFMGAHKAQLVDHSKPDLLIGTVLEAVDQLATWKYASFSVGVGTDATTKYIPYYGSKNDGETDTITYDSNTYNATIKDHRDSMPEITKHVCVKVSDTVGSKAVFGVFNSWEEDNVVERESGNAEYSWNDLQVAAIGNYYIRMQSGQTPEVGDYVESAGDGTAKVQSDDILRSKTIAKITSTIKQKTYSDGSFLITCTLHCG